MDITDGRRGWRVQAGRHLYDPARAGGDYDEDGWIATFAGESDAQFVAEVVAAAADERERAARRAAHGALWDARRQMVLAGISPNTVAHRIMDDALAALEPATTA